MLERDEYEAQNRAYYEQYVAGTLDIHEFLGFALRPLAAHAPADLDALARRVHGGAHPADDRRRRRARWCAGTCGAGDLCAIITATNSFVTAPIAREFGVEHLIATEPESRDGRFTGRVAGMPCFREGKVRAPGRLARRRAAGAWPTSPSRRLLQRLAQRPAAARARDAAGGGGPRRAARREAARRGWAVISLRG